MAPPIPPGQYSRTPSSPQKPSSRILSQIGIQPPSRGRDPTQIDKENNNPMLRSASPHKQDANYAIAKSAPLIDPKYRLRGHSPEDTARTSRFKGRTASSSSPIKKATSRSRSRSRIFSKSDKRLEQELEPPKTKQEIDNDFVMLLDEMQVNPDLRKKLIGMDTTVKASMLKGQASLNLSSLGLDDSTGGSPSKARKPIPDKLRKTRSSVNLHDAFDDDDDDDQPLRPPNRSSIFGSSGSGGSARSASGGSMDKASKRMSMDVFKSSLSPNLGQGGSVLSLQSTSSVGTRGRSMSFGVAQVGKETPESFAIMLKTTDARMIDVSKVKRMRAVVSSESPAWISQFIGPECGGYDAMLYRLDELLQMEWREEQHDDQLLHELLRCFVALSTTEVGRGALQSRSPAPFQDLTTLLFSEKKPGDLSTRKLIVDLLSLLPTLQVSNPLQLLFKLLQNPVDPAKESVVDFIKQVHTPRPFKTYLTEVASVCRDYFWIFCHTQNRFWRLEDLDEEVIRGPKVPGGMTGGVEFEAMGYLTTHMRLINTLASWMPSYELHANLFASGMERILGTLRRSSQHYYSPVHLEIARYFDLANRAGYLLPLHLTDWLVAKKQVAPQLSVNTGYGFAGQFIEAPAQKVSSRPAKEASPTKQFDSGRWLSNDDTAGGSVVGSAIKKWESLASPPAGGRAGLGMGWAGAR